LELQQLSFVHRIHSSSFNELERSWHILRDSNTKSYPQAYSPSPHLIHNPRPPEKSILTLFLRVCEPPTPEPHGVMPAAMVDKF
jgi:hypothetical protein